MADAVPLHTLKTTTVLSAMRLDGHFACRTFEGGTTKDRFLEYLREDLLPCLKKGDIVVMDNLRAHHTKGAEELLRSVDALPFYLLPYRQERKLCKYLDGNDTDPLDWEFLHTTLLLLKVFELQNIEVNESYPFDHSLIILDDFHKLALRQQDQIVDALYTPRPNVAIWMPSG